MTFITGRFLRKQRQGKDGKPGEDGASATIDVVGTTTGLPGTDASVINEGTEQEVRLRFTIPRGATGSDGSAATISLGTVTTGGPGSNVTITNSGTSSAAVFNFTIPRGDTGAKGDNGLAGTIEIGTVTTGAPGTDVIIDNVGTANAAILNITIPRGDKGEDGGAGSGNLPSGGVAGQYLRKNSATDFDASWASFSPSTVGLGNVNNTSDANKPVSTAQQTALNLKEDKAQKNVSGGYVGLSGWSIMLRNFANTFTSYIQSTVTASRTWLMPDKSGTVALLDDIPDVKVENLPDIRPTLLLDFANSGRADDRIITNRSVEAWYWGKTGILTRAAPHELRVHYHPLTKECLGIQLERQIQNRILQSNTFPASPWGHVGLTFSDVVSPVLGAMKLVIETETENSKGFSQARVLAAGERVTLSIYAKEFEGNINKRYLFIYFTGEAFPLSAGAVFDIATGAFVLRNNSYNTVAVAEKLPDGIYRISVTVTAEATGAGNPNIRMRNNFTAGILNYLGDGVSGFYMARAQMELGEYATSPITTLATAITRTADGVTCAIGEWFNPEEGTLLCDFNRTYTDAAIYPVGFAVVSPTANPRISIRSSSSMQMQGQALSETNTVLWSTSNTTNSPGFGARTYAAMAWSVAEGVGFVTNGGTPVVASPVAVPKALTTVFIGHQGNMQGSIRSIAYYPKRLTNAQLQELTRL